MNRLIGVAVLAASLFLGGCTSQQAQLPADTNPNDLAAAIALRGRGEAPPEPESPDPPPGSAVLGKSLEWLGYAGMACLAVPLFCLLIVAKSAQGGGSPYR
jgi:hypothetical protein